MKRFWSWGENGTKRRATYSELNDSERNEMLHIKPHGEDYGWQLWMPEVKGIAVRRHYLATEKIEQRCSDDLGLFQTSGSRATTCECNVRDLQRVESEPVTLRLDARLMMDRWRSLFRCAGVNSGREAALSAAADTHQLKKRKKKKEINTGKNMPEQV